MLIEKPSTLLITFLDKLLQSSEVMFEKVKNKLPFFKYSKFYMPQIQELAGKKRRCRRNTCNSANKSRSSKELNA
jgi:hypothetical protein